MGTTDAIALVEARAIVRALNPGALARRVWRAASAEGGREAAAILDLADGAVLVVAWQAGGVAPISRGSIVLAWTTGAVHERTWRALSEASWPAPSCKVAEEEVVRRAAGEGLCWPCVEAQLRRAYARAAA